MEKVSKNFGPSLLQKEPAREVLLEKMRERLARNQGLVPLKQVHPKKSRHKNTGTWAIRIIILALIIGVNYLFIGKKDILLAKIGFEGIPALPKPKTSLTVDEQALYWTYALYDFEKLKSHFHTDGFFAIDQIQAKRSLEALLTKVSPSTLGVISAYAPIGYRHMNAQGASK